MTKSLTCRPPLQMTKQCFTMDDNDHRFLRMAIQMARQGMERNEGGPFGAVVVKDGQLLGQGNNRVTTHNDPTAHAEIVAIRDACRQLGSFQLDGCTVYSSCEPCPMCLGAIYWARPARLVFACSRQDAAAIDFDDELIYDELSKAVSDRQIDTRQMLREEGLEVFNAWREKEDKSLY